MRTQVSIAGLAELSPSTKTQIKWQLIGLAQLASILDGCESILGVVISHKPIVVPVTDNQNISIRFQFVRGLMKVITGLVHRFEL